MGILNHFSGDTLENLRRDGPVPYTGGVFRGLTCMPVRWDTG